MVLGMGEKKKKADVAVKIVKEDLPPEECRQLGGKPENVDGRDICVLVKDREGRDVEAEVETIGGRKPKTAGT